MTCVVELVPADREERWLAVDDESFCHLAKQRCAVFPVGGKVIVVDGHCVNNMLDAIPLGNATGDDIRTGLAKNGEDSGKLSMFVELDGRDLRRVGVPSGVAMQFRTGAIEH